MRKPVPGTSIRDRQPPRGRFVVEQDSPEITSPQTHPPLVIYGSSGHSQCYQIIASRSGSHGSKPFRVVGYIDDYIGDRGRMVGDVPVISFETWRATLGNVPCVIGVSDPAARKRLAERITKASGEFAFLDRGGEWVSGDLRAGEGSAISPFAWIGPSCSIGRHVQLMAHGSLGHDCVVGDFVTMCPKVTVSGYVAIEDEVFIGAGATIVNGTKDRPLRIGTGAMVYAGAVVTKSVAPHSRVAGNPARDIRLLASTPPLTEEEGA